MEDGSPDFPQTRAALEEGVRNGVHYGAQVSIIYRGHCTDISVGDAAEGVAMRPDHVLGWSSSVKPLMTVALAQLHDRGLLKFEDPVSKHLRGFAAHGKEGVTIAHCLTHVAGLWGATKGMSNSCPPTRLAKHISNQALPEGWEPGKRCGYDSPAWYVLASVVAAVDPVGRSYEKYVEDEIFEPLGLQSCSVGMTAERWKEFEASERLASIYAAPLAKQREWKLIPGEGEADRVMYPCPAGNGRGPARELAKLYAVLLECGSRPTSEDDSQHASAGYQLMRPGTVELITKVVREGMYDELQGTDTAWSLGFALRSILSGRHASSCAFGHGGSQSSQAFADPRHGLAVACIYNAKPGPKLHYQRAGAVSTAIYEDLGLALDSAQQKSFKIPFGMGTF